MQPFEQAWQLLKNYTPPPGAEMQEQEEVPFPNNPSDINPIHTLTDEERAKLPHPWSNEFPASMKNSYYHKPLDLGYSDKKKNRLNQRMDNPGSPVGANYRADYRRGMPKDATFYPGNVMDLM